MGQKVNPHGLRVGVIKDWDSKWYAEKDFADNLVEDYNIRTFLKKKLYSAGVAKIEIERASERVKVIIYTAKPGVVIGKGGSEIEKVKKELQKYTYPKERVEIVPATEIIETGEPPVNAIRHKKDSSIVVGMKKVRYGEADAFVSSGSTGAVLVGGQTIVGRIKGVERPPLAPLIPTKDGVSLLIDCGANVDARPSHLVQFAMMGSIYICLLYTSPSPRDA